MARRARSPWSSVSKWAVGFGNGCEWPRRPWCGCIPTEWASSRWRRWGLAGRGVMMLESSEHTSRWRLLLRHGERIPPTSSAPAADPGVPRGIQNNALPAAPARLDAAADVADPPIGAAAPPSICRCLRRSCRSGNRRRHRIHSIGGTRLSRTGHAIRGPPSAAAIRAVRVAVTMPPKRLPDLLRVIVARVEGQDTVYEFDPSAAPSREWRAAFLRPPPALTTADCTLDIGRVAIHEYIFAPPLSIAVTGCVESTAGLPTRIQS